MAKVYSEFVFLAGCEIVLDQIIARSVVDRDPALAVPACVVARNRVVAESVLEVDADVFVSGKNVAHNGIMVGIPKEYPKTVILDPHAFYGDVL